MELERIEAAARAMAAEDRAETVLEQDGLWLVLRRNTGRADAPKAEVSMITAPWFGHFHRRHPTRPDAEAREGDRLAEGDLVGYVALEGRLYPVSAPGPGRIAAFLVNDGALVGYGQPLVRLF